MIERMTARAFRARFHKVEAPVLVGNGIWFPETTPALLDYATVKPAEEPTALGSDDAIDPVWTPALDRITKEPSTAIKHDLSKKTQAKGRTRR